ncbi:MAG TPA: DUF1127 domain-containing protein [Geminicoccaceae bacterium]|nr:DUF1127 domain-containing protein [Geminicoccus sp.]HMU48431.1 DUF1127 domain-containing protein [Geminicoccaceae bacterium]
MSVIEHILHVLAQYRAFATTLAELGRHSDAQLGRLGIERADVTRIAYERAERLTPPPSGADRAVPTWPPTVATSH